jgi:hypothetical protein
MSAPDRGITLARPSADDPVWMRSHRHLKLIGVTLVLAAITAAGFTASLAMAHSNSRWQSVAEARKQIVGNPLAVIYCVRNCGRDADGSLSGDFKQVKVGVIRARVAGMRPSRVVNGVRLYRHFEVRACALNYVAGGARVSAHYVWHTHRPPTSGSRRVGNRIYSYRDPGGTSAEDWSYKTSPIMRAGC